jgi:hypothetical protein
MCTEFRPWSPGGPTCSRRMCAASRPDCGAALSPLRAGGLSRRGLPTTNAMTCFHDLRSSVPSFTPHRFMSGIPSLQTSIASSAAKLSCMLQAEDHRVIARPSMADQDCSIVSLQHLRIATFDHDERYKREDNGGQDHKYQNRHLHSIRPIREECLDEVIIVDERLRQCACLSDNNC